MIAIFGPGDVHGISRVLGGRGKKEQLRERRSKRERERGRGEEGRNEKRK